MGPHRSAVVTALAAAALCLPGSAGADWRDYLKQAEDYLGSDKGAESAGAASALSQGEVARGLKEALRVGVRRAIDTLRRDGGFLDDPQVRIPLPDTLQPVEGILRRLGQGEYADRFVETMNHAAERAVPETLDIFADTLRDMTLEDARGILDGPDDAATRYLRERGGERITRAIRPIVADATAQAGVTGAYKAMMGKVSGYAGQFLDPETLDLDRYVTDQAVDGLFLKLAQEEARIREDPVARSTDLLKRVFGGR